MDFFTPDFFSALLAIIVIDLVLAGDNAIVIAMAARNLPAHLQKKAIIWGAVGAIAVRSAMTLVVVYLLKVPGLMLVGGVLLIWIAYRLLNPAKEEGDDHDVAATSFWTAMKTIVIADAVMGLDNVLAVAGAAQGSYLLVVLGLLISIPIVVWGSTQILKLVERYPAVIYLGAGILAWTAAKMILHEPIVKDIQMLESALISSLFSVLVVGGVLFVGFFKSQARLESNILAKLIPLRNEGNNAASPMNLGGLNMKRVLIPVDGSDNSQLALRYVINECISGPMMEVCLLNVQPKFSRHIGRFLSKQTIDDWHKERSDQALLPAQDLLKNHNIPFTITHKSGDRAQIIASEAKRLHCHHIVMGTARKNSLTRLFENSTSNAVIELTPIPVEIIAGKSISPLERWAVPSVGIGAIATVITAVLD